jgi:O-antigen ligase
MKTPVPGVATLRRPTLGALPLAWVCLAVAGPTLLAFNLPPSATFFNQAIALFGWGGWLSLLTARPSHDRVNVTRGFVALIGALTLPFVASLASPFWSGQLWALSTSSASLIVVAALAAATGAAARGDGLGNVAFRYFCFALCLAGLVNSAIGIIQAFAPQLADGNWIARTSFDGRAVGNLRQPNHLCSLLLWSIVAVLWLGELQASRRAAAYVLALVMLFVVVLSGSRTGLVGALMLALWGLLDRRLAGPTRTWLLLAPLAFALFWLATYALAQQSHHVFGGAARFASGGDISSSRFGIWSNTLALIRAHPWGGVGFGEFNFAWSLTPFPGRPVAFFDHTHNLPLQLAVELGLPLAGLVLGLLGWALWCAFRACGLPVGEEGAASPQRAAFLMVIMVFVHSLLEYPLWYAYFLLPTAFAFGLCLGQPAERRSSNGVARARAGSRTMLIASLVLMLGAALSVYDYFRVVVIFAPPDDAAPLEQRIAAGQHSWFFSHHADYAAATTSDDPVLALAAAGRAAHYLLDARLMMSWAKALEQTGDTERARFVAQRLKEFRNPQADEFFAPCQAAPVAGETLPFQCRNPSRTLDYADFR